MLRLRPGAAVLLPGKPLTRYGAMGARSRAACLLHALTWVKLSLCRPSRLTIKIAGD